MAELEYWVVDVFAGAALKGNPLAVVMNRAEDRADAGDCARIQFV